MSGIDGILLESCDGRAIQNEAYRNTIKFLDAEKIVSEAISLNPDLTISEYPPEVQACYNEMKKLVKSSFSASEMSHRFKPYKDMFE